MATSSLSTNDIEENEIRQMTRALKNAYINALKDGFDVLESKDGLLVKTHPDGTSTPIKALPPKIKVQVGQVIHLK